MNWLYTLDVSDVFAAYRNGEIEFDESRDTICERIVHHDWFTGFLYSFSLNDVVDNLSEAQNVTEFDEWWDQLYDIADFDGVWIKTF